LCRDHPQGHGASDLPPPESQNLEGGEVTATAANEDRQRIAKGHQIIVTARMMSFLDRLARSAGDHVWPS